MKTVVITGAAGKSGQFLLKRLREEQERLKDYKFVLFLRGTEGQSQNREGYSLIRKLLREHPAFDIETVEADLEKPDCLRMQLQKFRPDMILHIASVKLSWNLVSIALECGVEKFILVHTTGIYSRYKAAGEEYRRIEAKIAGLVETYQKQGRHIAVTILRPTMIYGDLHDKNLSVFIKMVDKLRILPVVNGARYDLQPVWCKDLGDAYFDVMMNWEITANKEYILSGGAPIQLREMFVVMAKQLGVKNTIVSCPYPIAYGGAWMLYLITGKRVDFREKVQRLVESRAYGHELAAHDFGYHPVCFEEGIREEIKMYQQNTGRR